jgi:hypothetical protein
VAGTDSLVRCTLLSRPIHDGDVRAGDLTRAVCFDDVASLLAFVDEVVNTFHAHQRGSLRRAHAISTFGMLHRVGLR